MRQLGWASLLVLLGSAPGCGLFSATPSKTVLKESTIRVAPVPAILEIDTTPETNDGMAFHVLVRRSTEKDTLEDDSYDDVVGIAIAPKGNATVVATKAIVPGRRISLELGGVSTSEHVVAYFLFSNPGDPWFVELPAKSAKIIHVRLGIDQVESVE